MVAPLLVYIYPPQGQNKRQTLSVNLGKSLSGLANGEGVRFQAPTETGFVMDIPSVGGGDNHPGSVAFAGWVLKDLSGAVQVFAVNCSHLGCSINLDTAPPRFSCPCHGSQFDLNGNVIHGPAVFPLSRLEWKQGSAADVILVNAVSLPGVG
ncbi:MAG TPA: Rieske 2Fe-2S domain-containing protein [Candidatus Dormibacteraeota bacterium]|nr:Rieske 2Fe-2S domain-containing protein [Candidatus Dormibacteraeota bacterium]